jgi:hypothetical protein
MPDLRREWTDHDFAKLRNLAGKMSVKEIAAELGRSPGATAVVAHRLRLSLRYDRRGELTPTNPGSD